MFMACDRLCAYCGEPATTVDHVPPKVTRRTGLVDPSEYYEVPACHDCNSQCLGSRGPWKFEDRCQYVRGRLLKRYHWLLKSGEWTASQLEVLGIDLRRRIQHTLHLRETVIRRLTHLSQVRERPHPDTVPLRASRSYFRQRTDRARAKEGMSERSRIDAQIAALRMKSTYWTARCTKWQLHPEDNADQINRYRINEDRRQQKIRELTRQRDLFPPENSDSSAESRPIEDFGVNHRQ